MRERTAAIVVVGNEILSGKVQDTNAYFAARELRRIGVALKRICVVPDELEAIANEVNRCAQGFEFVLTSGGVGPTHDDITIEGVARAFRRRVIVHPELEALVREFFQERLEIGMKMAEVPEGSVLIAAGDVRFPTIQLENVFILPGIPQIFEKKLTALLGRFTTDPYYLHVIYTSAGEGTIAHYLNGCLKEFPDLLLGSYPRIGDDRYRVKLTLESKDREYLEAAFRRLIELLPPAVVVSAE